MSTTLRRLLLGLCVCFAAVAIAGAIVYWHFLQWADAPLADTSFQVDLQPGQSLSALAADLQGRGLLDATGYFAFLARASGADRKIQAGEYQIEARTTPRQLLTQLMRGEVMAFGVRVSELVPRLGAGVAL